MVNDALPSTQSQHTANSDIGRKQLSPNSSDTRGRKFAGVSIASKCRICNGECQSTTTCKTFLDLSVEDRWKKIKSIHLCFTCLKGGHQANRCFNKRKCNLNGCNYYHHTLLHSTSQPNEVGTVSNDNRGACERRNCHLEANREEDTVLFQMIKVRLYGKNNSMEIWIMEIYAFVDDGANASMLDAEIARELKLTGKKDVLELQWLNRQVNKEDTEIVKFVISGVEEGAEKFEMSNVFVSRNLELPMQSCNMNNLTKTNPHLVGLPIDSYAKIRPKMIISLNHAFLTVPTDNPQSPTSPGPIAVRTRLGWIIYGPINSADNVNKRTSCHIMRMTNGEENLESLEELMQNYFETETFGIKSGVRQVISDKDERALSILSRTTKRQENRFESGLLWCKDDFSLPASYHTALNRLEGIERKMARDPQFALEYKAKINEYLHKGYARELTVEEAETKSPKTFYLPHFAVRNPNKAGIRLVFDAAAESAGTSLNKALLVGPDLNQPLISILLKFRQAPIAVCGDIKEMFHQVKIMKEDQDAQRFLWRHGDSSVLPKTLVMQRMLFGIACSPTIAQYVKNSNAETFFDKYPRAVKAITGRHYVDDYVDCFQSVEEAERVVKEVIAIHKTAGFEMHNILTNSKKLREKMGSLTTEEVNIDNKFIERVLGMYWMPETDEFTFKFKFKKIPDEILTMQRKPTKREMLALTMSIFDPFGFVQNFTLSGKILLQAVWKSGVQWDEPLPNEIYAKWQNWLKELARVEDFRIPRCYSTCFETADVELHIFCDASEEAMATVAYWRYEGPRGTYVVFVAGKTACAPTKFQTIPRLELQSAVLATRLKCMIAEYHEKKILNCIFWSDSQTVINWIRSNHRNYKQFVANRVSEILDSSQTKDWRWCPGELNPADDASRAKFPIRYDPGSNWKNGPDFLRQPRDIWPVETKTKLEGDHSSDELKIKKSSLLIKHVSSILPNIANFSSFSKIKRAMAWVLRYISNSMKKPRKSGELTAEEELEAEILLCKWVQQEVFTADYNCLAENRILPKSSILRALNPYLDDSGLMRVKGRLENADFLPFSARRPIILPRQHSLTKLIVLSYHRKLRHINTDTIITEIRQRYWIPAIRSLVRNVQASCTFCIIKRATPTTPQMGCLPPDRVTPFVRPFSYTGLDFFGPVNVTIGRRREKRWVALFTCLSVRAVHLEIATNLSSDACILCIRNFINRRGVPVQIRSDNGTNFVGIDKELRNVKDFLDEGIIRTDLAPLGIEWKFNTPSHPSSGGAWERLVRSVKRALSMMLVESCPRLETFHSLLLKAENIVNSRPLTHLPITPEEPEPLTPNHFLLGITNSTQTPAPFEPRLLRLRKQWKLLQNMKNGFWKRWIQEYLPDLTRRTKWCLPTQPMKVGCLVLICERSEPRSHWRRGRVIKLHTGKDGVARSAEVKTSSGLLKRPISKLALLDVETCYDIEGEYPSRSIHGGGDVGNPAILSQLSRQPS